MSVTKPDGRYRIISAVPVPPRTSSITTGSTFRDSRPVDPDKEDIIIHYDYREDGSGVPELLKEWGVATDRQTLEVGDYQLSDTCCIERKTGSDFVGSLFGGEQRLFEQIKNLADAFDDRLLIIEGKIPVSGGLKSKERKSILGALGSIAIDFHCSVLQTSDFTETAELLRITARREQIERAKGIIIHRAKRPEFTLLDQQLYLLSGLPKIRGVLGNRMLEIFHTPRNVFNATTEQLKQVSGIGDKTIQKILWVLNTSTIEEPLKVAVPVAQAAPVEQKKVVEKKQKKRKS